MYNYSNKSLFILAPVWEPQMCLQIKNKDNKSNNYSCCAPIHVHGETSTLVSSAGHVYTKFCMQLRNNPTASLLFRNTNDLPVRALYTQYKQLVGVNIHCYCAPSVSSYYCLAVLLHTYLPFVETNHLCRSSGQR